ncbi:MAG: uracil-DNA glycosylase [Candidatus Cloacimonetes bacterium]|nr:uracil-DNA glycosylase [Candidatus Cloacimonadota bacterium]
MSVKAFYQYLEFLKLAGIQDIFIKEPEPIVEAVEEGCVDKARILHDLSQKYANCQKCGLSQGRINLVYGQGNADAKLMLIGEGPGANENKTGQAFVGAAGELLDRQLHAIKLTRQEVYIANIVKCQPPYNRNPEANEVQACMPYLLEQIEIVAPQIILLLGRVPAHAILETTESISRLRLRRHLFREIPVYVTYHPAALLRDPKYRVPTWEDLQRVRDHYFSL